MDQTRHVILKKLEFGKRYEARFGENQGKLTRFDVPQCREMVDDMTMCAPPPVSALQTHWNVTNPNGYALMITWTYMTDQENISLTETNAKLSMSHFKLQLNPLITPDNEKCEKLESIRRDVTWTHRQVQFYVPDAECNYEAEISAVDSKQRQSENKKIKISRINEPSTMNLLFLRSDLSISIGFIGILIVLMLLAFLLMVFVVQRGRKTAPKVVEEYAPPGDRLVYAYVDSNDSSKTIIGVRNLSNRSEPPKYEPTTQIDSYLRNTLHIYHNNDDDSYETIPDYRNISISSETSSQAEPYYSPPQHRMDQIITPAISNIEQYNLIKSRAIQDFQLTKICVPEGNPAWRMINVLDVIGGGSFAMKFAKDSTLETQQSMKKEIEILSNLHYHPNFVRFEGLVTKRIGGIVNIIGLLMENCRGGSLRQYIQSVGSQLRRQAMSTPMSDSPPSSGYDSLNRHEKLSSEISSVQMTTDNSVANMSLRFCQFSEQIGAALEHLHRYGIIHTRVTTIAIYLVKDFINPLDVLCDQTVKLGDFGMSASSADEAHVDQTVMPPEVCIGKKYEAKGDIWQFGTCLVEMCSLGVSYQMQKEIPTSGIEEFDKLPATKVLHDAAKKCLNLRNRPSASDLRAVFQTDTARDLRTLAIANLEKHNQSLLV
ncbi:unnamed protein product [Caenorhabditis angaria]|uniref:Protein kinase domain-containing protein n=1 Tax=Caenorhabditis angaria TaxID=860376 RepID=A0A9P1J6F4_9PELO|nr:unnamed protein product [Caenorhabditis angaria]